MLERWCRTDICSFKLSAKVFLMLDNPFLVPSLCKLNHISVCFIQISTKSAYSLLESNVFFEVISSVLGRSVNFNIKISIKTARVSRLYVLMTMVACSELKGLESYCEKYQSLDRIISIYPFMK